MCDTIDMTKDKTDERILEAARNDSEVLSFALNGGRGMNIMSL